MPRDDLPPRQLIDGPAAVVGGPAALALAAFLRRYQREWRELAPPYAQASIEVADTVAAICLAADMFKRRQLPDGASGSLPNAAPRLPSSVVDDWLSVKEAADRLRRSERWVRRLLEDGRLSGRKVNGRWLVDAESLEK
ncbi:MAG: helix-turn-helix domain-containing protein [Acidimicrobiia bacterium]